MGIIAACRVAADRKLDAMETPATALPAREPADRSATHPAPAADRVHGRVVGTGVVHLGVAREPGSFSARWPTTKRPRHGQPEPELSDHGPEGC
jgi:hypothetical protein